MRFVKTTIRGISFNPRIVSALLLLIPIGIGTTAQA